MQIDVKKPILIRFSKSEFPARVAQVIAEEIRLVLAARGVCRIALAGGETPRAIHESLVATAGEIGWQNVWVTFGDERCVPPSDPASNYGMARESLLEKVPIPPGQVLRMRGELPRTEAAIDYERQLAQAGGAGPDGRYVHDIIMLGMGEDGHTASLFPGSPALNEAERNVLPVIGTKPPPERVTMTLPLLNAARKVFFMVVGTAKAPVLRKVLSGDRSYPSARVQPVSGEVTWLLTEELAKEVER